MRNITSRGAALAVCLALTLTLLAFSLSVVTVRRLCRARLAAWGRKATPEHQEHLASRGQLAPMARRVQLASKGLRVLPGLRAPMARLSPPPTKASDTRNLHILYEALLLVYEALSD